MYINNIKQTLAHRVLSSSKKAVAARVDECTGNWEDTLLSSSCDHLPFYVNCCLL